MRIEVIAAIVAFAFMPCAAVAADYYLIGLDNNGPTADRPATRRG